MMIRLNCLNRFSSLLLLALFFSFGNGYSQETPDQRKARKEAERLEKNFGGADKDFEIADIPEKWKNESAIIICQKNSYLFDKNSDSHYGSSITQQEIVRKRIKLLDKAAVEEYSEFYFVATKDLGVRIIKPDGSIATIDLKDAVPVGKDVSIPGVYKSSYKWEKGYQKLAIAGLEPNDIIDYFNIIDHTYYMTMKEYVFPDVLLSLENSFPVMKQKFSFQIDNELFFNFRSSNGAPTIQEGKSEIEGLKLYTLTDSNREKIKDERWSYIYRSTPSLRFQVIYKSDLKTPTEYLLGKPGQIRTSVSKEEIALKANQMILKSDKSIDKLSNLILKYFSSHKDVILHEEIAKISYYLYRNLKYTQGNNNFGKNDDKVFVKCLAKVFDKRKIKYSIVTTVPSQIGTLNELVLKDELIWFLKLDESGKFLTSPSLNTNFGDIYPGIQGVDAYQIKLNKNPSLVTADKITLPFSKVEQNGESDKIEVNISKDLDEVIIYHDKTVKGYNKDSYESAIIYGDSKSPEKYRFQNATDMTGIYEQKRKRIERFKTYIAESFDLISYDDFSLVKAGRYDDDPFLEFTEKYQVKGPLRKAGVNYIFQVGKLIGTQIEISEEELQRNYDVFSDCPRAFFNEIAVTIPEGYSALGIEKLNKNISNEAGSFISKASVEGKILKITTSKIYLHNFEKKEDWGKIVQFLDAAYDFTQARILFKKLK
jgi:hypothetical protein